MNNARKLQQEVTKLKEQNNDLRAKIGSLEDQEASILALNRMVESKQKVIDTERKRVLRLDKEIKELNNYLEVERPKKEKLEAISMERLDKIKSLNAFISEKEKLIVELECNCSKLKKMLSTELESNRDLFNSLHKESIKKQNIVDELQKIKSKWWFKLFNR